MRRQKEKDSFSSSFPLLDPPDFRVLCRCTHQSPDICHFNILYHRLIFSSDHFSNPLFWAFSRWPCKVTYFTFLSFFVRFVFRIKWSHTLQATLPLLPLSHFCTWSLLYLKACKPFITVSSLHIHQP